MHEIDELAKNLKSIERKAADIECVPCELVTGAGMLINVCKELKKEDLKCEELERRFLSGEITQKDIIEKIEPHIKDRQHKLIIQFLKTEKKDLLEKHFPEDSNFLE